MPRSGSTARDWDRATPTYKFCFAPLIRFTATRSDWAARAHLIDEAHLIKHGDQGMYLSVLTTLREFVPDMRVVGLTATPYRLDSGHLCEGEGHIFDDVVYEYSIARGIREGFLSPLSSKEPRRRSISPGLASAAASSSRSSLRRSPARSISSTAPATKSPRCRRPPRLAGLLRRCEACRAGARRSACPRCKCRDGTRRNRDAERDRIIEDFRAGRITCLVSVMVLSYGFNVPFVDLVALLRPTCSPACTSNKLAAAPARRTEKAIAWCSILPAMSVASDRLTILASRPRAAATAKRPPNLSSLSRDRCASRDRVPMLWIWFPRKAKSLHATKADTAKILSSERTLSDWLPSRTSRFSSTSKKRPRSRRHINAGSTSSTNGSAWGTKVLLAKKPRPGAVLAGTPIPQTIEEALEREDEIAWPSHIRVEPDGRFWRIVARRIDGIDYDMNLRVDWRSQPKPQMDDAVPY